jgi:hypothetical protein
MINPIGTLKGFYEAGINAPLNPVGVGLGITGGIASSAIGYGVAGAIIGGIRKDEKDKDGNIVKKHTLGTGFITGAKVGAGIATGGAALGLGTVAVAKAISKYKVGQGA